LLSAKHDAAHDHDLDQVLGLDHDPKLRQQRPRPDR
jgi:hypothetical protein